MVFCILQLFSISLKPKPQLVSKGSGIRDRATCPWQLLYRTVLPVSNPTSKKQMSHKRDRAPLPIMSDGGITAAGVGRHELNLRHQPQHPPQENSTRRPGQADSSNAASDPSLMYIHENNKHVQVSHSCLLVPVAVAFWWYWLRRAASRVVCTRDILSCPPGYGMEEETASVGDIYKQVRIKSLQTTIHHALTGASRWDHPGIDRDHSSVSILRPVSWSSAE